MYHCRIESYNSEDPVYQKLAGGKDHFFFAEARVARDYVRTVLYEKQLIDWSIQTFCKEDQACLDIGAHMGHYALNMAYKAKHVHAFECSPKSFNYLCANIALQDKHYAISKYNVALSNKEGTTKYYIRDPKDGGGNGICHMEYDDNKNTPYIEVPTRTLDSFGLTNIGFIKLDVEGHEKEVIEGAVETLRGNNWPTIMFESWVPGKETEGIPSTRLREELFSYIRGIGYNVLPVSGWPEEFLAVWPRN